MELMINSHPDLEGVLTRRTAAKLKVLSKGYYVKGTSQMNKAALVCAVTDALKEPDRLSELLLRRASESPDPIKVKDPGSEQYRLLDDFCYLVCADTPDGLVVSVPTQIRAAFEQLKNDGFLKQKDRFDLLHNYAMAAIHLYGAITQDEFVDIFNQQNSRKTSVEELFPVLIRHIAVGAPYCLWEDYIV